MLGAAAPPGGAAAGGRFAFTSWRRWILVLLGRGVAAALLGEHVDDDRAVPLGGVGEGLLHHVDVVAVDGPGVAHAQGLEEGVRGHHLPQGAGEAVDARVGQLADAGDLAEQVAQPLAGARRRSG